MMLKLQCFHLFFKNNLNRKVGVFWQPMKFCIEKTLMLRINERLQKNPQNIYKS